MDDWVSADEIANIRLRLANISSSLQDDGGEDDMLQAEICFDEIFIILLSSGLDGKDGFL